MGGGSIWIDLLVLPSDGFGYPASPHWQLMQSPACAHLHLFASVRNHAACYETRQKDGN